jgi:hypothetical protein
MANAELTEREKGIAETLIETLVVLGCSLIRERGEEAARKAFEELAESRIAKLKNAGKLGKGFEDFAKGILMTAPLLDEELHWDIENKKLRITKCGLWEAAKKLGYEDTPMCIRCKATSDAFLKYMLPGYKKTIVKSLWKGNDECYMTYAKEG